jgi:hypothetical protein
MLSILKIQVFWDELLCEVTVSPCFKEHMAVIFKNQAVPVTMFLWKVKNQSPSDIESHPTRPESWTIILWEPQISEFWCKWQEDMIYFLMVVWCCTDWLDMMIHTDLYSHATWHHKLIKEVWHSEIWQWPQNMLLMIHNNSGKNKNERYCFVEGKNATTVIWLQP